MAILSYTEKFKIAFSHNYFNQLINQRQRPALFDGVIRPALEDLDWSLKLSRGCFYAGITMFALGIISLKATSPKNATLLYLRSCAIVYGAALTAIGAFALFKLIKQVETVLTRLFPQFQALEGGLHHLFEALAAGIPGVPAPMAPPVAPPAGRPQIGRLEHLDPRERRQPAPPHVWGEGRRLGGD
jgi:hypothetical protein